MVVLGLLLGMIGTDVNSGAARFSFDVPELSDGIEFAAVAMGMFGFAEIMLNLEQKEDREVFTNKVTGLLIKWSEFVRTNHGQVVEPQREMLTQKVRTVGISLIDRIPGPYDLSIGNVWATNATEEDEILRDTEGVISGLPVNSRRRADGKKDVARKDSMQEERDITETNH